METNESILTRDVVSIDDRKLLGRVKGLCVDCDTSAVNFYIINNSSTNDTVVLPFEKSLALGDTFMTIQNRSDFLPSDNPAAKEALQNGFKLVGVDVYSRGGNRLGTVEGFEFDPTYGTVTKIVLGNRVSFPQEAFMFFSPDFVFVDDGEETVGDLRKDAAPQEEAAPAKNEPATAPAAEAPAAAPAAEAPAPASAPAAPAAAPGVPSGQPDAPGAGQTDEEAALKDFLVGSVVDDDVVSQDGSFRCSKGTMLTKEMVDQAADHDALLLLTMSVNS